MYDRTIRRVANAFERLERRLSRGLELFNAMRKEFPNTPQSWISVGYQLGARIDAGIAAVDASLPGERPFLKDIPIVPPLLEQYPGEGRILYRFRVALREKYGRAPKIFISDVWSDTPLNADSLRQEARDRALALYASSPGARRGGGEKEVADVQEDLIFVGRRY